MEKKTIKSYMINNELDLKNIVNDYSRYIFIIIKNTVKGLLNNEDIEEMISDVLLVIWKNKDKLKKNLPLKPYIAGITKNLIKNKLRNIKQYNKFVEIEDEIRSDLNIDYIVENKEMFEIINKELNKIGENSKIFIMFYCYGKKVKEIANELGDTQFNVNIKLHRMKKKIKDALEKRGYYYGK